MIRWLVLGGMCVAIAVMVYIRIQSKVPTSLYALGNADDIVKLFPKTPEQIQRDVAFYKKEMIKAIDVIKAVPDAERTFANTVKALDNAFSLSDLAIYYRVISTLKYLHPDAAVREQAGKSIAEIAALYTKLYNDKSLYEAFKAYAHKGLEQDDLSPEQRYFITQMLKDFVRSGLDLPDDKLAQVTALKKELTDLSIAFDKHIAEDNRTITATREQLVGADDAFIDELKQTDDGLYIVGVDYPTYFTVMEQVTDADTRRRLFMAFQNRAYPANDQVLRDIIAKRDQLAQLLGFDSYASLDLNDQMAQSPEKAESFLSNLRGKARLKAEQEHEGLVAHLPEGVQLSEDGKLYPWDIAFVKEHVKKQQYDVDERLIAEYFPVKQTVKGLLGIYEQFFSLKFKKETIVDLWSGEVEVLAVYNADDAADTARPLGYFLLDLYPRDNKYSHAAHLTIVPSTYDKDGKPTIALSLVMANFPRACGDKPALFKRSDVKTFFHEFGHALHALLGRTRMVGFSGTNVKNDFVEMPSQMLEEWLTDKQMLKMVSGHYHTGEPLSDVLIGKILALKNFDTGSFVQRQSYLAKLALTLYKAGADKDPHAIESTLAQELMPYRVYVPDTHMYAAFGHLTGYAAKYYGYLWSKVFALDLFDHIKHYGLLDSQIGSQYKDKVLSRGGSADPNELLQDFLGRPVQEDAFFKDMGIE